MEARGVILWPTMFLASDNSPEILGEGGGGEMPTDPRTDRHPDDGTPGKFPDPPDNSKPYEAPGGAGTGTSDEPAKTPPSHPNPPDKR